MSSSGPLVHPSDGTAERERRDAIVRALGALVVLAGVLLAAWVAWLWWGSHLPGTYDVMAYGELDGGGTALAHDHSGHVGVATLTERAAGPPTSA